MKKQIVFIAAALALSAAPKPRARDLGVPFDGTPGALNAITDVRGVEVGFTTLIRGEGELKAGQGPVAITNTHSVGVVRDAIIAWEVRHGLLRGAFALPVVAETNDGWLNDINGFHVKPEHVFQALESASGGPVPEGNVGGGTGMHCYDFKGGTGTASRKLPSAAGGYTVGVLVQANFGSRQHLLVAGAPVGKEIGCDKYPCRSVARPAPGRDGSIIIVVATDAPLIAHQLKRLARRASLGGAFWLACAITAAGCGFGCLALTISHLRSRRSQPSSLSPIENFLPYDRERSKRPARKRARP